MRSLHNTPTDAIFKSLAVFEANTAKAIKRACDELAELNLREVPHPFMKHGILSHYKAISRGDLLPDFAFAFSANPIMRHVSVLTLDDQRALLLRPELSVAAFDKSKNIVPVDMAVTSISRADLDIVFGPAGIRTFAEQEKVLRSRNAPKPRRDKRSYTIKADADSGEIVVNDFKFKPGELSAALKALGFKLVKIP